MALYLQTNPASLEAQRNLANTQRALGQNFQRLSSGYRINSAADDAAGLGVSEQLRAAIRSYAVAERNTNGGLSMVQTADSALGQIGSMLQRMRELAVEGANGDLQSTDRGYLDTELGALKLEITRIVDSSSFNGQVLLGGAASTITFQVGAYNVVQDTISVAFNGVDLTTLGLSPVTVSGATAANAQNAITAVDGAISAISSERSKFGAAMNRFSTTVSNIQSMRTNLAAADSRIRDVDVAEETASLARNRVLAEAGAAVLAQANQAPQLAMTLLG